MDFRITEKKIYKMMKSHVALFDPKMRNPQVFNSIV